MSTTRDPRTGRFTRPVPGVDAGSRFNPMGNAIEDVDDVSAAEVMPGMSRPRYAPEADGGGWWPAHRMIAQRRPVLAHPDDRGNHNEFLRTAARSSGAMDPSGYLTGMDDGLSPKQRADALARRTAPAHVTIHGDTDGD